MFDADLETKIKDRCFYAAVALKEGIFISGDDAVGLVESAMTERGISERDELLEQITLKQLADEEIERRIDSLILSTAIMITE